MTLDEIRRLYEYSRWATARLTEAAVALPDAQASLAIGGSFGSLIGILQHMAGAEWVWLERFLGRSPRAFEGLEALTTVERVRERADDVARALSSFLDGLDEESLGRIIAYTSFKGDRFEQPLGRLLQHVVNHATYHRGQVAMALRLLGVAVPGTDLSSFYRLQG